MLDNPRFNQWFISNLRSNASFRRLVDVLRDYMEDYKCPRSKHSFEKKDASVRSRQRRRLPRDCRRLGLSASRGVSTSSPSSRTPWRLDPATGSCYHPMGTSGGTSLRASRRNEAFQTSPVPLTAQSSTLSDPSRASTIDTVTCLSAYKPSSTPRLASCPSTCDPARFPTRRFGSSPRVATPFLAACRSVCTSLATVAIHL
ncbi:hypothetical protein SPRG_17180, partial [Saprolegnia parasitica CBS 223.65]